MVDQTKSTDHCKLTINIKVSWGSVCDGQLLWTQLQLDIPAVSKYTVVVLRLTDDS